jgi:glycosyltransferase involved in cell wall biosynthesis
MRVAIVLNSSWNVYNFRLSLITSLQKKGYHITVIAPKDAYSERLIECGCAFEDVPMDSRGINPLRDIVLMWALYKVYKKLHPDVILHYTVKPNIYGTVAASLLRIPMINNVCGLGTVFLKSGMVSLIATSMYKIAFRFPNKVFFQNEDDLTLFTRKKLIRQQITDLIPGSGIDLTKFSPAAYPKEKLNTATPFTFLVISRLIYDKGIMEYIEAIRILREKGINARFQLLGAKDPAHKRGIPLEIIDQWISEGLIEYLGTAEDVRPIINDSDCVVLPSYREGLPRTLLEAASFEKPIVTTNTPGCRHVVKNHLNGYLCEVRDANDLADKMYTMYNKSGDERASMGKAGRALVQEKYDEKIVIESYFRSIEALSANGTYSLSS